MIALLQSGVPEHREPALSVIASVAASAEHKLHAFAERLLPELASFLSQAPPSDPLPPEVKARAIECAGLLFGCVPKETALFLAPALASTALAALTESSTELREFTFGFFGHLADAIGPAAAELLPRVVPVAAALCVEDDMEGEMPGKRGGDEEDEEGEEGGMQLDVRTGVTEEKCSAAHCIASLAKACGAAFMPFMADARKAAESCAKHAYPEVRRVGLGPLPVCTPRLLPTESQSPADGLEYAPWPVFREKKCCLERTQLRYACDVC